MSNDGPFHNKEEIAWAAGLYEGEGSIILRYSIPAIQVLEIDLDTLQKFQKITNSERLYEPYIRGHKPF